MKIAAVTLIILLGFLTYQIYSLWSRKVTLDREFDELQRELTQTKFDQTKLEEELRYLANPLNLEKELRARFNLKAVGEELIIVVPFPSSSNP